MRDQKRCRKQVPNSPIHSYPIKVREIFHTETDEEHELSYDDLITRLQVEYGDNINKSEKAIKNDVKTLIKVKPYLTVNEDKYGKKYFSFKERLFEVYELRLLMDAVSAARFITDKQRESIIEKIQKLASMWQAEKLVSQIYIDDIIVNKDEKLKTTIAKLHTTIQLNKDNLKNYNDPLYEDKLVVNIANFRYGRFDLDKNFIVNANEYNAIPLLLVMNNGFYYLVAYNTDKSTFINYRVDRIRDLNTIDEMVDKDNVEGLKTFNEKEHLNSCYNMYPGYKTKIKVKFDKHLINAIIDRFGIGVNITADDEKSFILKTEAAINTGLVRWILNWGSDAVVLEPESLRNTIKEESKKMLNLYNEK